MLLLPMLVIWVTTLLGAWLYFSMKRPKDYPPGPLKWPLLGALIQQVSSKSFVDAWSGWAEKYGKIFSVKNGQLDFVVITDYDLAKEANAMEELADRPPYEFFQWYMKYHNGGLLFSNGENWKKQRRFTLRSLRDFGFGKSTIEHLILQELQELAEAIHPDQYGAQPSFVHLDAALNATVTNIIWWLMANKRVTKKDPDFLKLLDTISSIIEFDAFQFFSAFPQLFRNMPSRLLGMPRKLEMREHFYDYMHSVIQEHKSTLVPTEKRDLIDCYLLERQRQLEAGEESFYSDDMIAWSLADLFIAGSETTSTSLRWFLLYMIHNLDVQKKVQAEIDRVVGRDRLPLWEDREKMPYTQAAVWELLRMTPALPFGLERIARADINLGGYRIPKGTIVTTVIHIINRDPRNFEDANTFKPERFIHKETGELIRNKKFMPFQAGKRQCLGEALARMTLFLGAAFLLQKFTFTKVPGEVYSFEPKRRTEVISVPPNYKVCVLPRCV